MLSYRTLQVYV